jgi:hypothetical protein
MSFCKNVIKEMLEFTSQIFKYARNNTKRKEVLSEMCNDYREAYNFLLGNTELSFKPSHSIRELNRKLLWLNYDKELHKETINEVNETIKRLSN